MLKELVENAIDAGATDVRVELIDGGKELISVSDNGEGMSREDTVMCIKRHATSKISSADDLFNVATMGFRGEALASISSVSKFSIQTRQSGDIGTKLDFDENGMRISDWSGNFGTTISVSDIFYNVPARKSFLKASQTEYSHCLEYITSLALSLPEVGITLIHNGKEQFRVTAIPHEKDDWAIGESPFRQRVKDVLSKKPKFLIFSCSTNSTASSFKWSVTRVPLPSVLPRGSFVKKNLESAVDVQMCCSSSLALDVTVTLLATKKAE